MVRRRQITTRRGRKRGGGPPDLRALEGVVAPRILQAMRLASEQLQRKGIRHALVGGLAVGAYGFPRATKDVDFLVGEEAFEHHGGGLVTIAQGIPVLVGDVPVDPISIAPEEAHLEAAVAKPVVSVGIPVAPIEALIFLKLKSPRRKDAADIVELLKAGAPAKEVRRYLAARAPDLLAAFETLAAAAEAEEEE